MPTLSAVRQLALSRQGLSHRAMFGSGLTATQAAIEHLGYVQIDTLARVERAHHHVLWSRVPDYQPAYLQQLVDARAVFEYWFHAAAYLPLRDYRFALPRMESVRRSDWAYYREVSPELCRDIVRRIRDDGPLRLRKLEQGKRQGGSWWNWGPAKRALEKLFLQGELTISQRIGMEKVYELSERWLPDGVDLRIPDATEHAQHLLNSHLRAHGVTSFEQITHLQRDQKLKQALRELIAASVSSGQLQILEHLGLPDAIAETGVLDQAFRCEQSLRLLSPFDNAVIHRARLEQLFAYHYRLECYLPAPQRQFGYFCLPILYGQDFIGRIDCKAHRTASTLEVLSLHLDSKLPPDVFTSLHEALLQFAHFNGCQHLSGIEPLKAAAAALT